MRFWKPRGWQGEAGASRVDITPPVGIRAKNWGASATEVSTGIHRPLTMTGLALRESAGDPPVVLITADLGWWRRSEDEWMIRGAVLSECGLDESRVIVHLIHTHAGPSHCGDDADMPGGEFVPSYLRALRDAAVTVARDAIAACVRATMTVATGHSSVAACRDLPWQGRYVVGFNPDVPADDTLLTARIADTEGRVLATLVNYACHPTTLAWDNTEVSPDYVGALREVVEAGTGGAPCLFLQGAAGDLAPREQYSGDTALADRHGISIGHAALAALETLPPPSCGLALQSVVESGAPVAPWRPAPATWPGEIGVERIDVPVTPKDRPTREALEQRWAHIDAGSRAERIQRALRVSESSPQYHPLWTWRLGDVILFGHPGEAFSIFQKDLRARLSSAEVFVLNHVNGPGWVYLPPTEFYEHDAYQVWQTTHGPGTLESLTDHALAAASRLAGS